jgi:CHAD domain-containing protein
MTTEEDAAGPTVPPRLCDYAATVIAERLDRMLSHIEGVRRAEDPAHIHQMRVWSRRSRAALEVFDVCFTGKLFAEVEREVKAATDALSEARDLDVIIQNLEERAAKLPASQRVGVESFIADMRSQRERLQKAVAAAVTDLESHHLAERFRQLAERGYRRPKDPPAKSVAGRASRARNGRNGKGGRRHG